MLVSLSIQKHWLILFLHAQILITYLYIRNKSIYQFFCSIEKCTTVTKMSEKRLLKWCYVTQHTICKRFWNYLAPTWLILLSYILWERRKDETVIISFKDKIRKDKTVISYIKKVYPSTALLKNTFSKDPVKYANFTKKFLNFS